MNVYEITTDLTMYKIIAEHIVHMQATGITLFYKFGLIIAVVQPNSTIIKIEDE